MSKSRYSVDILRVVLPHLRGFRFLERTQEDLATALLPEFQRIASEHAKARMGVVVSLTPPVDQTEGSEAADRPVGQCHLDVEYEPAERRRAYTSLFSAGSLVDYVVEAILGEMAFFSSLVCPGLFEFGPVRATAGATPFDPPFKISTPNLRYSFRHWIELDFRGQDEAPWPDILPLEPSAVASWLRRVPGYAERVGEGRVGRALAALSRVLLDTGREDSGLPQLVWSMLGLEALFAPEVGARAAQLKSGITALHGASERGLKAVSALYRFRSDLVHGAVDLPIATPAPLGAQSADDLQRRRWSRVHANLSRLTEEDGDLATILLIASLQRLITLDQTELASR